LGHNLKLG